MAQRHRKKENGAQRHKKRRMGLRDTEIRRMGLRENKNEETVGQIHGNKENGVQEKHK